MERFKQLFSINHEAKGKLQKKKKGVQGKYRIYSQNIEQKAISNRKQVPSSGLSDWILFSIAGSHGSTEYFFLPVAILSPLETFWLETPINPF